jgi:hypothetical protein
VEAVEAKKIDGCHIRVTTGELVFQHYPVFSWGYLLTFRAEWSGRASPAGKSQKTRPGILPAVPGRERSDCSLVGAEAAVLIPPGK